MCSRKPSTLLSQSREVTEIHLCSQSLVLVQYFVYWRTTWMTLLSFHTTSGILFPFLFGTASLAWCHAQRCRLPNPFWHHSHPLYFDNCSFASCNTFLSFLATFSTACNTCRFSHRHKRYAIDIHFRLQLRIHIEDFIHRILLHNPEEQN